MSAADLKTTGPSSLAAMLGCNGWRATTLLLLIGACRSCPPPPRVARPPEPWDDSEERREAALEPCSLVPDAPSCAQTASSRGAAEPEAPKEAPPPRPRCDRSDPNCGPWASSGYAQCYDPEGARKPAFPKHTAPTSHCEHDGECIDTGCGRRCLSYLEVDRLSKMRPRIAYYCHDTAAFDRDDLLCGCVDNRCMFFTQ